VQSHHPESGGAQTGPPAIDPAEARKRNPATVVTATRHPLRIDFAVEPMVNLRLGRTALVRVEPTLTHIKTGKLLPARTFNQLFDEDLAAIDEASARFASLYLHGPAAKGQPPVMIPASFRTMSSRKGRNQVMAAIDAAPARVKSGVLIELVEIDKGTPPGRLTEVAGLLLAVCRGVFVRVTPGKEVVPPERGSRLAGLTLDVGDLDGDARVVGEMLTFAEQMRGLAPALMVQGLPSEVMTPMAMVAGLSHAGVRAQSVQVAKAAAA
jgi:hypothetical protein